VADRLSDVALQQAVQLKILAGGDPQRPVGPAPADVVVRDVGIGRDEASRDARPDHQLVVLVEATRASLLAAVAIVLLVDAMELEKLLGIVAERGRVLEQLLFDESSKVIAWPLCGPFPRGAFEGCAVGRV